MMEIGPPDRPPLLMTPGPSRLPAEVRAAGGWPMLHHRSPEFSAYLAAVLDSIKPLFGTDRDVLLLHCTGRGGMEAALTNLCSPGDVVISCCNGKFGEMWASLAEIYGLRVRRIGTDWTRSLDLEELRSALAAHPEAAAVTVVHSDTSTGVLNDVEAVARVAKEFGALTLVDCISSLGSTPFGFDRWGVDVAITASQKGLMASTGACFVAVSADAWEAAQKARLPKRYLDFTAVREALGRSQPQTPGSTPVHLIYQCYAALALIHREGLEAVFQRHRDMAKVARDGVAELGLTGQCPELESLTPTVTGVRAPDGVSPRDIRRRMLDRGILLAGGLGPFQDSCFRIGHLGNIGLDDVRFTISALASVLAECGAPA